jgi:hypothetical protein
LDGVQEEVQGGFGALSCCVRMGREQREVDERVVRATRHDRMFKLIVLMRGMGYRPSMNCEMLFRQSLFPQKSRDAGAERTIAYGMKVDVPCKVAATWSIRG